MDKSLITGKNKNGVNFEIFEDSSIGDFYLIIEDANMPAFTGTLSACQEMAKSWVE